MKLKRRILLGLIAAVAIGGALFATPAQAEDGYGTLTGKFVLDGDVPKLEFLIKGGKLVDGGLAPKNPEVCAVKDLSSDALIIDPKSKGIGNIFVYLRKAPDKIHPALQKAPAKELVLDQVACRFVPHSMIVRTGQTVLVKSDDACPHNFHTYPLRNEAENFTVTPKFRKGVPLKHEAAELLPMKITCDIHPWMKGHWMIVDHPYAVVTADKGDAMGSFKIEKLPYGTYEFRVWHEKAGYIGVGTKRGFEVKIDKENVMLEPFKVPLKTFE